jgi:hypothetical protein
VVVDDDRGVADRLETEVHRQHSRVCPRRSSGNAGTSEWVATFPGGPGQQTDRSRSLPPEEASP